MQQQVQGPSKASRDAQAFLYRRFGLGNAPQYAGTPQGVPQQTQQQAPTGGGMGGGIDPRMLAALMQSRQQGTGGPGMPGGGF